MDRKYVISFGAIAIGLLMISSAFAGNIIPQSYESFKVSAGSEDIINNVEQGIYLCGSEQRKIIFDAINYVDDPYVRIILKEIIKKMDMKGFVDSNDIKQILSDNKIDFIIIRSGPINTEGCAGNLFCLRRPMGIFSIPVCFALLNWWANQNAHMFRGIHVTISSTTFTENHHGTAIGFSGTFNRVDEDMFGTFFNIDGSALLFFVILYGSLFNQAR